MTATTATHVGENASSGAMVVMLLAGVRMHAVMGIALSVAVVAVTVGVTRVGLYAPTHTNQCPTSSEQTQIEDRSSLPTGLALK